MSDYNLNHLLTAFWQIDAKSAEINQSKIDTWAQQYVEVANPDFMIVFDMCDYQNPILFQKNFKLKLPDNKDVNVLSIIESVDVDSAAKIFKADERVIRFANECYSRVRRISYRIKFEAEFFENQPRSLVRDITILSRDTDNKPNLILVTFFDITELYGKQSNLQIDIKKYDDDTPDSKFDELKKDLKNIISPLVKITKREKEILELISHGKTSEQIAQELIISVATVNTHRQNLIRKHNVNNTSAILKSL